MLSIYYFFNPSPFYGTIIIPLYRWGNWRWSNLPKKAADPCSCPVAKLPEVSQDPQRESFLTQLPGALPSPHLKSWGSREQWEGPRAWVKGTGSSLALSYSPLKWGFWARAFQNWMHDGLYIEACHSLVLLYHELDCPLKIHTLKPAYHNAIYVWRQARRYWRLNEVIG